MSRTTEFDVVIIGGSISGLMHALVLKSLGRNVHILEARSEASMQTRAAGLSLWPHAQTLLATYASETHIESIATLNSGMQIRAADGTLLADTPITDEIWTSSWANVHKVLWQACMKRVEGHGTVHFECGSKVHALAQNGDQIVVRYLDGTSLEREVCSDLVIAADGARSFARNLILPRVKPRYAGYLAWRGNMPEKECPEELKDTLDGKLVNFGFDGSYVLAYLTPGETGSMQPGERLVEWCWYDTCQVSSSTFADFMTDSSGRRHNVTVPAHLLRPEVWNMQVSRRKNVLSPLWENIFSKCGPPLLTAVCSFDNKQASFLDGKLILAGEAYTQIRPHLGASCDIPALQALRLAEVLKGRLSVDEYEREIASYAADKAERSRATGIFAMTGRWPEGFEAPLARL